MRNGFWLVLALLVVGNVYALDKEAFDAVVDFETTLADIPEIAATLERGEPIDERVVLLEGTVSGTVTLVPDPEQFEAILFLLTGEWDGVEEMETYECYIRVVGPEFAERLPARRPREPAPGTILINSRVLVAGVIAGLTMDGTVLIDGFHVRVVD